MKNTMEYKGYVGSVEFAEEKTCFFGKVLGIVTPITYEGESAWKLRDGSPQICHGRYHVCTA